MTSLETADHRFYLGIHEPKLVTWQPIEKLNQHRFFPGALREFLLDTDGCQVYLGDIN